MEQIQKTSRYYTLKDWKKIIKCWKKSGLSIRSYCKQKGLKYSSFAYWKKRVESPKSANISKRTAYPLEKWKEIIEDWQKSGYSQHAYCLRKKICLTTFCIWYKKVTSPQASDLTQDLGLSSLKDFFVPLTVTSSEACLDFSSSIQKMEVIFAGGHRLSLQGPFDWEELNSWLTPLLTQQNVR